MKELLIAMVPIIMMSCNKQDQQPAIQYDIDTKILVTVKDREGNDLLNNGIKVEDIELESFGELSSTPLPYYIDPTINVISPNFLQYRPANDSNVSSSIEIHMNYVYPSPTTIIRWNNHLPPDTLQGEVVYSRARNAVMLEKLYLNGEPISIEQQGNHRNIVIEKKETH